MGTDVSDFKDQYKIPVGEGSVSSEVRMPGIVRITFFDRDATPTENALAPDFWFDSMSPEVQVRYGTNPHQALALLKPRDYDTPFAHMKVHKIGKGGFSKTNLQDMSQAINVLKYFDDPTGVIMKHIGPCGLSADEIPVLEIYRNALSTDDRSAFGGTVGFNRTVDGDTAKAIMELFTENVIATGYTERALEVFKRNEGTKRKNNGIRIVEVDQYHISHLPRFWGDDLADMMPYLSIQTLPTGELTIEHPYLTGVRSVDDLIVDPAVGDVEAKARPDERMMRDAVVGWYTVMNTRSNAVALVNEGHVVGIGMGQQDRVGAVELAVNKAKKHNLSLEGAVLVSEAFFPNRDSIDYAGRAGVGAVLWPAGSRADKEIIEAGNEYGMSMMVTPRGERCFTHN